MVFNTLAFIISIHALHEESDIRVERVASITEQFQSTLSMRRATRIELTVQILAEISIHALHEESDLKRRLVEMGVPISIHALHEESDKVFEHLKHGKVNFNPRSP